MKHRSALRAALTLVLCAAGSAFAASPYPLDRITLERNGSTIFTDEFADGFGPPVGGIFPGTATPAYINTRIVGDFSTSEAGGKLWLDPANDGLGTRNPFTGALEGISFQAAYLNVNTQDTPETATRGLKLHHTFSFSAVFDFQNPTAANGSDSYGIRLADFDNAGPQGWDDVLDLAVFRSRTTGEPVVLLIERNFHTNTRTIIAQQRLTRADGQQIELRLTKGTVDDPTVTASFTVLAGGVPLAAARTLGSADLFEGEIFTRPGFYAVAGPVPEPATWAMALGGLALLGGAARRRRG